jgi:hypothetical protein
MPLVVHAGGLEVNASSIGTWRLFIRPASIVVSATVKTRSINCSVP